MCYLETKLSRATAEQALVAVMSDVRALELQRRSASLLNKVAK